MFSSANQNICLNPTFHQLTNRMLRRFCFQFPTRSQVRQQCQMDNHRIVLAQFPLQLANTFYVRKRFYITDCPSNFCNNDVIILFGKHLYSAFDFVGNVRNNLNCFPKKITFTLLFNNSLVDFPSRNVVVL